MRLLTKTKKLATIFVASAIIFVVNEHISASHANITQVNEIFDFRNTKEKIVGDNFRIYNKSLEDKYVKTFIEVIDKFDLSKNDETLRMYVAQICQESGAKHYHKGNINKSSGNAIGFTQITPTTAFYYLKNKAKNNELVALGASDYSFINNKSTPKTVRTKLIKWLSDYNNNIILWGYMSKSILDSNKGNIKLSLIEYKDGRTGMKRYVKTNRIDSHTYLISLNKIVRNSKKTKSKIYKFQQV